MTRFRRSFGAVFIVMGLAGVTLLVFGGRRLEATAVTTRSLAEVPAGMTDSDRQIEKSQLSGLLEEVKLMNDDAQPGDSFGSSIAISGDTLVVGTYFDDGGPGDPMQNAGAAYIFERSQDNWVQTAKLTANDAQEFDWFGYTVAISGDTVVVGTPVEDGGPGDPLPTSGAAYIFERNMGGPGAWGQVAKLTSSDIQSFDQFGFRIAMSGDTLIVGAINEDGGAGDPMSDAGAVYIFERDQGGANNWGQVTKLKAADPDVDDQFGSALAISEDTLIVGVREEDGGPGDPVEGAGAAYIYERDNGGPNNWGQAVKLIASDPQTWDLFGASVAIQDDTVLVGAFWEDGGPDDPLLDAGAVYVFGRHQGGDDNWGESAKLFAGDAQEFDYFGGSVAIDGDYIVISASHEDGGVGDPLPNAGALYIFQLSNGDVNSWHQLAKVMASDAQTDDYYGFSKISGETIFVGVPDEDGGPGDPLPGSGTVYVVSNFPHYFDYLPVVSRN